MSNKDLSDSILKLEPLWNDSLRGAESDGAGNILINALIEEAYRRNIIIDFGDNKMAACNFWDNNIIPTIEKIGYDICIDNMYKLGMKTGREVYKATRMHNPLMPTETEKKKLQLLEEGISLLADDPVMKNRINLNEAKKPRFIFNAKEAKQDGLKAESVCQDNKYLGHWVDRDYLNNTEFYKLLGAWLHEITHKYGGDNTQEFGYKLTDVMGMELESLMNDPIKAEKLKILRDIFNELD